MPQLPLFISSSAKAGTASNGSFAVDFQPPLELPADAKNATVAVQQLSCPYTTPNITASTNTLIFELPNHARTAFQTLPNSTVHQKFTVSVPPALHTLESLELAINTAINKMSTQAGGAPYMKRDTTVTQKTVSIDGTDGVSILAEPVANFLSFVPDYAANRLQIRFNYTHSSILFSNTASTMASTLGFTVDMSTTAVEFESLKNTSFGIDILWRAAPNNPETGAAIAFKQFSITVPTMTIPTVAVINAKINGIVAEYLDDNHDLDSSPFTAMISAISVKPFNGGQVKVKLTYTDESRVKIRGDITDTGFDSSSLAHGQLRANLSNPGFAGGQVAVNETWQAIDNPYGWNTAYIMSLMSPVGSTNAGANASYPSLQEIQTALFVIAIGAANPGSEIGVDVHDTVLGSGLTTYVSDSHGYSHRQRTDYCPNRPGRRADRGGAARHERGHVRHTGTLCNPKRL